MKKVIIITFLTLMVIMPEMAYACATCFGNPNAAATQGMNKAIITMLGITGGVLGGFGSSIFILRRRAQNMLRH